MSEIVESNLPSTWKLVRLGDIAKTTSGGTPRRDRPQFYGGQIPWVKSGELGDSVVYETGETITDEALESSNAKVFPKGTLCIALYGATVGKLGILGIDAATNQAVCAIFPPEGLDTRYLYRFFESKRRELIEQGKGGAQPNISQGIIRDTQIPVAPPDEQGRIVAEIEKQFTRMEAGAAALRRVQANLKRYRAAVLKAACEGRLVATEAERLNAEGRRLKDFESGEQLLKRILTERRQNWQGRGTCKEPAAPDTTNLPTLPDSWTWVSWEMVLAHEAGAFKRGPFGSALTKSIFVKKGFKIYEQYCPINDDCSFARYYITPEKFEELQAFEVKAGDYLISCSGVTLGRITRVPAQFERGIINQALLRVRINESIIDHRYFLHLFRSALFQKAIFDNSTGSAIPNVKGVKELKAMAIPLPPLAEQTRIVAEVERRLSVVEELEAVVSANLQRATRLRQSILQKAFTGELVVQSLVLPTNVIELPKAEHNQRPNTHFARALLSAEIVHRLHREPTFGRIKHQKIFHLCEHIAQLEEIDGQYHREAAGPLDNKLIYANEAELKKQKWYQEVHRESYGHAYEPLANAGNHRKYVEGYWPDKLPLIEKLIELMRGWNTDRCEIFCTTYAAWNDLVILGQEPTEVAILREILERWHDSKKRFSEDRWCKAIGWMRKKGFVPTGFGKPTKAMERK